MKRLILPLLLLVSATSTPASEPAETSRFALATNFFINGEDLKKIALQKPLKIADDLRITHMGVGTYKRDGQRVVQFSPTTKIVRKKGRAFGWVVRFDTTRDTLEISEKFILPEKGTKWTVNRNEIAISGDGTNAVSTRNFEKLWDWTFNFWSFDAEDPLGTHSFELSIAEQLIAKLPFEVTAPSDS